MARPDPGLEVISKKTFQSRRRLPCFTFQDPGLLDILSYSGELVVPDSGYRLTTETVAPKIRYFVKEALCGEN